MTAAPLAVGTLVRHINQEWARPGTATARITAVAGPYNDGSYEYQVLAGWEFARQISADNPMTRTTWWSSLATTTA